MKEIIVHVKKSNSLKISVQEAGTYRYINGYSCSNNCTTCSMYNVDEFLLKNCKKCNLLTEGDLKVSLKLQSDFSEEIIFSQNILLKENE